MFSIRAHANCDHALVAWKPDAPIPNCLGFALYRQATGREPEIVTTFVGPKTETKIPAGTSRPSTVWPIQKFMWSDYLVGPDSAVRYRVVAMCGADFDHLKAGAASSWSNPVSIVGNPAGAIQCYFNRGVVSTQWVARQLVKTKAKLIDLVNCKQGTSNPTRDFLGGPMKLELLNLLKTQNRAAGHIYASLFELNDPEVVPALEAFGQRAHIILSDGTHKAPKAKGGKKKAAAGKQKASGPFDENAAAREQLRDAHVEVHDRMVTGDHFAHHKFIVFMDPMDSTRPTAVWTGSMNLTYGGVCTQANNSVLIKSPDIAGRFFAQWRTLVKAGDAYPDSLSQGDAKSLTAAVGSAKVGAWFAPNPMVGGKPKKGGNKYGDHPDLKYARQLIQNAKEGILFLVFNPGFKGTLLNDILNLLNDKAKNDKLYIHGVANQDPTGGPGKGSLIFVHGNTRQNSRAEEDIVLPAAVSAPNQAKAKDKAAAKAMAEWVKRVDDYWQSEPTGLGMVRVHSKVIVIDPFGAHPIVITGSHNLGPKASAVNDDNMVIIEAEPAAAEEYAVNIETIYDQYRWCFQQQLAAKNHQKLNQWNGLQPDWATKGQLSYLQDPNKKKEVDFWLGQ
jgi:phosphatidylserine/phosphatidylglycerophosphate/cardiolipin synthase-like enzyme